MSTQALSFVMLLGAQEIQPPFNDDYVVFDLGSVPGLPGHYGGVTFLEGDPNTLCIGGNAARSEGTLYTVAVYRDAEGHIFGFSGDAIAEQASAFIDGGLAEHPTSHVLFKSRYHRSELGLSVPGSAVTDKILSLSDLGLWGNLGGLGFVPVGYPGAGLLKLASYSSGDWYSASLAENGSGTYDVVSLTQHVTLKRGPEGFIYVPPSSPEFTDYQHLLLTNWQANSIDAFEIDANGDPIVDSKRTFMTGVDGAEGGVVDPTNGDFLFSTFDALGGNRVLLVTGFGTRCGNPADSEHYGSGWPGTLGVPTIALDAIPQVGTTIHVTITNSLGSDTIALLFVGMKDSSIPTHKGGTILAFPDLVFELPLPPTGLTIPYSIPDTPEMCGLDVYVQVLQSDPGASHAISFTDGLSIHFGS